MHGSSIPMKGHAAMNLYQGSPIETAVFAPGPATGPSHHPPWPNVFTLPVHVAGLFGEVQVARVSVSWWVP